MRAKMHKKDDTHTDEMAKIWRDSHLPRDPLPFLIITFTTPPPSPNQGGPSRVHKGRRTEVGLEIGATKQGKSTA